MENRKKTELRKQIVISKQFQSKHLQIKLDSADVPAVQKTPQYELADLISLRERLNATKSKLDPYYIGSKTNKELERAWIQFQGIIDIYKPMRFEIERNFNAKHVTNAWMKYWEIYTQYDLIPATTDYQFHAFFNAELPGAALCAWNHYMKTMRPNVSADWRASSLAPAEGSKNSAEALGDIYGLYNKNKDKWLMTIGDDPSRKNNGDVTVVANLEDFAVRVGPGSSWGGVDLYSHDAGIDVSCDGSGNLGFSQQELANAKIHLGCALAGFLTLKRGGSFIAKQYTFFETFTWNLILIYSQLFDEFHICKPLTSRPYNSEIYLVGKGFKGLPDEIKSILISRLENFHTGPFIPSEATKVLLGRQISDIQRFARIVFGQQIVFIEENVELFDKYRSRLYQLRQGVGQMKADRIAEWLKLYPIKAISSADRLPSNDDEK